MAFHDAIAKIQPDCFFITAATFLLMSVRRGLGLFSKLPVSLVTLMFLNADRIKNAEHRIKV